MIKKLLTFAASLLLISLPLVANAQVFSQYQLINAPLGAGVVVSTSTANGAHLAAVATSSLKINTGDLIEGSNLFFTTARALASFITNLAATTSVSSITTLPNLSLPYVQLTGVPAFDTFGYPFPGNATTTALTLGGLTLSNLGGGGTLCLHVNNSGTLSTTASDCGSGSGGVTSVTATNPLFSSGGSSPNITTLFSTTTTFGLGNNGFLVTSASGVPFVAASSTLNLPNSALANSAVTVNGSSISLGGSATITANTTNALTFNNSGSGAVSGTIFNGGTAQTISYNTVGAQVAGNYITALTGDITASGPGSVVATLATVNAGPGTYTNATVVVNGKGLVTSASSGAAPTTYTGTFPIQVSGSTISSLFSTTTNSGMAQGFQYVGSGGIFQTAASSSLFGFTPQPAGTYVTAVNGTANQITSSGGITPTLSLPNHVIFPIDYVASAGSTTNATTTNLAIIGGASNCNGSSALTTNSSGVVGCTAQPQGTVTAVSVATANGFAGSSSGGATPALTLTTSVTGLLKGNGTVISAATPGTDYDTFGYPFPSSATSSPLTFTGLVTTTNASTTLFSSSYASSTNAFFGTLNLPGLTGTQCLHEISGVVSGTGSDCGSGGGAVSSVSNFDGTLTISPTTGAVVASLALANSNIWTSLQQFSNSTSTLFSATYASTTTFIVSGQSGCASFSAGVLTGTGSACGSGGGGAAYPFTPTTNFGVVMSATSTPIFDTAGLFASSTSAGGIILSTPTNIINAFSIFNAVGANVFNVDTTATNPFLGVGATSTPWGTLSVTGDGTDPLFAVATSSNTGLPNFEIDAVGHIIASGPKPICTTGCTLVAGSDNYFRIITGSAVLTETITFAHAFILAPVCNAELGSNLDTAISASSTPTTVVILNTTLSSKDIDVSCIGIQ